MTTPINMVMAALANAHYHVLTLESLLSDPSFGPPPTGGPSDEYQRVSIRYHAHLRAFFWELISVFEMLLHHLDKRFAFDVDETSRRTIPSFLRSLQARAQVTERGADAVKVMADAYGSEWGFEVFTYRNASHLGFLASEGLVSTDGSKPPWMVLSDARVGQSQQRLIPHLNQYRDKMFALAEQLALTDDPKP